MSFWAIIAVCHFGKLKWLALERLLGRWILILVASQWLLAMESPVTRPASCQPRPWPAHWGPCHQCLRAPFQLAVLLTLSHQTSCQPWASQSCALKRIQLSRRQGGEEPEWAMDFGLYVHWLRGSSHILFFLHFIAHPFITLYRCCVFYKLKVRPFTRNSPVIFYMPVRQCTF